MQFKNDNCTFEIPDRPTVRQQLMFFGAASGVNPNDAMLRYWEGAKVLISKWESKVIPDYKISLDDMTDPTQAQIIIWAGLEVLKFMNQLEDIPKN
jgi:hypothetical protein